MRATHTNQKLIKDALKMLQIEHLTLGIFDQSFPSFPDEETGWGTPYSRAGFDFINFFKKIGINTIQLGPQGKVSKTDISPYNSTIFADNPLSISLWRISQNYPWLFSPDEASGLAEQCTGFRHRVNSESAWNATNYLLSKVTSRYLKSRSDNEFTQNVFKFLGAQSDFSVNWFERSSTFELLTEQHQTDDWAQWPEADRNLYLDHENAPAQKSIEKLRLSRNETFYRFTIGQFLLHQQHNEFRSAVHNLGIKLYGDLQIGFSHEDVWAWRSCFLSEYLMGAPPSRSNPDGQPWGYPVLDPNQFGIEGKQHGAALRLIEARIDKMFSKFDGLRIDHPHGLICPWVYKRSTDDPFLAVQNGARLYSSPNLPDHPALSNYSIVSSEQLNKDPSYPRYGENWVTYLTPEQIERYATLIDVILKRAQLSGADRSDILCEVLSTWPLPLKEVMNNRKLGRFCVTQKADPENPDDIYRRENTNPSDWIMAGNHDTKPVWRLAMEQQGSQWYKSRARLLAHQFSSSDTQKETIYSTLLNNPNKFSELMFAELFLGPAQHVFIFFTDLLGIKEVYNKPGIIDQNNWSIRIPSDYYDRYVVQSKNGEALNIPRCLALAIRSRYRQSEEALQLSNKLDPDTIY